MDWQQGITLLIVTFTAGMFVRAWRRKASRRSGCHSGCACEGMAGPTPRGTVIYRARKGERPQIITRMS